jgi:glucose/arabinose dehydrogenase
VRFDRRFLLFAVGCAAICGRAWATGGSESGSKLLIGQAATGDWTGDAPGIRRKLTVADLPLPNASRSASNFPTIVSRPRDAQLHVPDGFRIEEYAAGLRDPRVLLTAPNGDIFVTESRANQIKVMRDKDGNGKPDTTQIFSEAQLNKPFGIAFYPPGNDPE